MTLEEKLISALHGDNKGFIYFNLLSIEESRVNRGFYEVEDED